MLSPSDKAAGASRLLRTMFWAGLPLLLAGLLSLQIGKSAGFDFLEYHYYNGYAAVTHRLGFDIFPAGIHTFFNPAADTLLYIATQWLPARLIGFLLGAIHGLNFVLAAAIAAQVLPGARGRWLAILLAGAGFLGAANYGLLGSFHHDNVVSIFFLLSLLVFCGPLQAPSLDTRTRFAWLILGGAIVGAGTGLKFTLAPYTVGILFAPLFFPWPAARRAVAVIACGAGIFLGLLLIDGYQMLQLYRLSGDPIFPFLSRLARPPFDQFMDARDLRFQPEGVWGYLIHPLRVTLDAKRYSDTLFRDFRLPVTYLTGLLFLAVLAWRWITRKRVASAQTVQVWRIPPPATLLLGVVAISHCVWLWMTGIYRYAMITELLSFIILAILLFDMLPRRQALLVLTALGLLIVPSTQRFQIARRPWGHEPFVVTRLPAQPEVRSDALVLLVGDRTGTYFIPAFPASVRFLGADILVTWPPHNGEPGGPPPPESAFQPFARIMHDIADHHAGQVLLVYQDNESGRVIPALRNYHYRIDARSCGVIRSNIAADPPLRLCELQRG